MNNYNLINNKFYYKYINKKKILKKLKKYILLILNNKYKNKYNIDINFKKGKILFFKELLIINKKKLKNKKKTILYSNIKNKNKYKIGYILKKKIRLNNNILYLINKRSEERRVGKVCLVWCRCRWSPVHLKTGGGGG
ncbi:MAG: hypothetical protein NHG00_00675, partial [Candidatus Shikimatogenerans sp. JK-2022]|nr:hypothetical protein [Candidatus Shikimatogenerans bostrichidophilus]